MASGAGLSSTDLIRGREETDQMPYLRTDGIGVCLGVSTSPGGDPPPYEPLVPPDDERDRDEDDIPDTPGIEPPPVPMRDPRPDGAPTGPYIA